MLKTDYKNWITLEDLNNDYKNYIKNIYTNYNLYNSNISTTLASDPQFITSTAPTKFNFDIGQGLSIHYVLKTKEFLFPDGTRIKFDSLGNFVIDDSDAKVIYKSCRIREFSLYLNASDMLAKFAEYLQTLQLRKDEVLELPIRLFIAWLIIQAAKKDNDTIPEDIIPIEQDRLIGVIRKPRCSFCGRFVKRIQYTKKLIFCSKEHGLRFLEKRELCDIGVVAT